MNTVANGVGVFGESLNGGQAFLGYGGYFQAPGSLGFGVYATGGAVGVRAVGGPTGVSATGTSRGVRGSTVSGSGVYGENTGSTGIGVEGRTSGVGSAVFGHATTNGVGVYGKSETGTGTYGVGGPRGVYGSGTATGVEGSAGNAGTGVYGHNSGSTGIGVWGKTDGVGSAVFGEARFNGVGVYGKSEFGAALRGDSPSGTALQVTGKATFSRSGVVTLGSSASSVTKTGVPLTAASYVLATLQTNTLGLFIQGAVPNPAGSSITIYFSKTAPIGTKVAFFVVN
jgi:hypothetical protein